MEGNQGQTNSFTLPNGLTVIHSHRPGSALVAFSLRAIAGSLYEAPRETGASHFLEHIVSDGTQNYPDEMAIAGLIDGRGGYRNAYTNRETVEYVVRLLKDDLAVGFEYLAEISMRPLINEAAIAKQKKIIEQEVLRIENNPEQFAPRLLHAAMYPGTRMSTYVTGSIADVQKLNRDILVGFWRRTYVAANMVLAVCGDVTGEQVRELAQRYFAQLPTGSKVAPVVCPAVPLKEPLYDRRTGVRQSILAVGFPAFAEDNPHRYSAQLLTHLLGSGKTSRLRHQIREQRGLAYSVSTFHSPGRVQGHLTICVGADEKNLAECLRLIRQETKDLAENLISEAERGKALAFAKSGLASQAQHAVAEASQRSWQWCLTGKILTDELDTYALVAANPETIHQTAQRMFADEPAVAIITPK